VAGEETTGRWSGARARWAAPAGGLLVAAGALLVLWRIEPVSGGLYPPCPIRFATGLHCPGCGTLRALHALLRGEPGRAFRLNPLSVALLPVVLLGLLQQARPAAVPWLAPPVRAPAWRVWLLFGLVVAFGVLRNLPVEPFSGLAPH